MLDGDAYVRRGADVFHIPQHAEFFTGRGVLALLHTNGVAADLRIYEPANSTRMNITDEVHAAAPLRLSRIRTPARPRSPKSSCFTAARFTWPDRSPRANANAQATSDWMALERERGISITSTVLQFPYDGHTINLLDTPGHQDFGEDTYRTLLAADSAVMLIDAAKGVEPQTKKLFAICRERGIPLFTFMNKLDRPSRDPLELLDELETVLGIGAYPMNWPLGSGDGFRGVYDRRTHAAASSSNVRLTARNALPSG